jgi:CCR4-NOT transcription complex subunit 1
MSQVLTVFSDLNTSPNWFLQAYEKGLMIAVIPFTSKILEPCQSSLAYQPPNPWTMGILGLLAEIYALPNLKMNLKFDIEVLYKNLGVDMKDVKATQLLRGRMREIEGNPDFSNKDLHTVAPVPPEPTGGALVMPMLSQPAVELPPELSAPVPHPAAANAASLSQVHFRHSLPLVAQLWLAGQSLMASLVWVSTSVMQFF